MPAPSKLSIATSSLQRLVKEESSYHKEIEAQQKRIAIAEKAEGPDENTEYILRQERQALDETKKVIPQIRLGIEAAAGQLETALAEEDTAASESPEEIERARRVLEEARRALRPV